MSAERADLLIGAVLIPGARAPVLVTRELLRQMEPGSAIVDISVDQGGCVETTRPTTHTNPRYIEENVVHYAVANMPGAVPQTSTYALTNATLPYAVRIADKGWQKVASEDEGIKAGLNIVAGKVTYLGVAEAFGLEYTPVEEVLS